MPRALKEKAVLFNDIEKFLMSKGAAGAKAYEIAEHLKAIGWANLQPHQISHALGTMRDLHHVSKWKGQGRGDSWVSKKAQEIANKEQVKVSQPVPDIPNLVVDVVESTGRLRIQWAGLLIEIGKSQN